jgi:hypothetical protein
MSSTEEHLEPLSAHRKWVRASQIELAVLTLAVGLAVIRELIKQPVWFGLTPNQIIELFVDAVAAPNVLALLGALFFDYFSFLLGGRTLLAATIERITANVVRSTEIALPVTKPPRRAPPLPPKPERAAVDELEEAISRSHEMVRSATRRPNALLFVGTIIAFVGLVFFLLTLPGFLTGSARAADAVTNLVDLAPRLLMLIFIQVLAGFFLRQYRLSMEELRYYEAILRHREDQLSALRLIANPTTPHVEAFANRLLSVRDFLTMKAGITTTMIEAQKLEENEFKSLYERFLEFMGRSTDNKDRQSSGS